MNTLSTRRIFTYVTAWNISGVSKANPNVSTSKFVTHMDLYLQCKPQTHAVRKKLHANVVGSTFIKLYMNVVNRNA